MPIRFYFDVPHLQRFLAGDDPVPVDLQARWGALPASAQRKQSR